MGLFQSRPVYVSTEPLVSGTVMMQPQVTGGSMCLVSYTLAAVYFVLALAIIILPWALADIFTLASAFTMTILGIIVMIVSLAHIYYIHRIVMSNRKCVCP